MMAIFMPAEFKSLNLNNLLKLQQQQQQQQSSSSQIFTNESLFKPYFNNNSLTPPNVGIMTELNSESAKNRLCSEDDSNSNDSELSVGQEKVQQQQQQQQQQQLENNSVKDSPHSDDEMSNASSSQYTNSSTRLCSPQEMMRPSMQFHEEILRSSQLYAEELLRQRIAAAARLQSSVTDVKGTIDEPEPSIISKLSFQTSLFNSKLAAAVTSPTSGDNGSNNENGNNLFCAKSAINFQNIHSHLSSIAQITQNLSSGGSSSSNNAGHHHMKKDDASLSSLSRESSQSPSGFQQFKLQQHNHHHHHPHHHHHHHQSSSQQKLNFHTTHQNQLHEHNLKFSIDNILKADFGRRITEPLLKSSRMKRALREGKHEKDKVSAYLKKSNSSNNNNNNGSTSGAEGQLTNDKSMDQTYTSSTATTADNNNSSTTSSSSNTRTDSSGNVWPAWVFCTRYSDRPSSGRSPRVKKSKKPPSETGAKTDDEKRPRTAFSGAQLARLKHEFNENRYLTEKRRQALSGELGLNEAQIKIWFQNKRAKIKKSSGVKNPLALQLMAQGLYNHSTIPLSKEEEELQELQAGGGN